MRITFALIIGVFLATGLTAQAHDHEHGEVDFPISCSPAAQTEFHSGLAQLHHMMYEQARPHFRAAAEADPECAMAYWGIAMTHFQPLWNPTSEDGLERGRAAVERARDLGAPTAREEAFIAATEAFFTDPVPPAPDAPSDHAARTRAWMDAQRQVHEAHPDDVDAAALYALATVAHTMTQFSPEVEHDYGPERRVGAVLERQLERHPHHPGLHHYLIHAYDSPTLAHKAERVAARYDGLAPETPHALHMPSHVFVRLGNWEETAELNERSAAAALRQADFDDYAMGHYVHALDYVMYAYLQMGQEDRARETLERILAVDRTPPAFAFVYGLAAPQARYYLERGMWEEAARLEPGQPDIIDWDAYPAATALVHYARGIGAARTGDLDAAAGERQRILEAVTDLEGRGDQYWAHLTSALGMAVEAWMLHERGNLEQARDLMRAAAELEESMDKHPITPGEVLPVRELYGDLLLLHGRPDEARAAFQASLERTPNRRYALDGIQRAESARR